jgi:hypothetical protein
MMKNIFKITLVLGLMLSLASCHDKASPNYQYMPNMYESVGYETYSEASVFKGGVEAQLLPKGTIKRGFVPYDYPNTTEGYEASKVSLKSPLDTISAKEEEKSKELYTIYCGICHGDAGNGKGWLATQGKYLGIPSYKDRVITEGSVFHVQTYGLNSMGSYANQLNTHERWLVAKYVMKLKNQ